LLTSQGHILHALAAFGLIKETGIDTFTSSRPSSLFADANVGGAVAHVYAPFFCYLYYTTNIEIASTFTFQ
jgi:hypothetical protein